MQNQQELFNVERYQTFASGFSSSYDPTWDLYPDTQSTCESVGEQVQKDTKKTAPQHDKKFNQWVEKYWVERGSEKYWYFRYMWMEGRKLRRKYLGSTNSTKARNKKVIVEEAILDGLRPNEIVRLLDEF